jgi:hypothetical protein
MTPTAMMVRLDVAGWAHRNDDGLPVSGRAHCGTVELSVGEAARLPRQGTTWRLFLDTDIETGLVTTTIGSIE